MSLYRSRFPRKIILIPEHRTIAERMGIFTPTEAPVEENPRRKCLRRDLYGIDPILEGLKQAQRHSGAVEEV